MQVSPINSPSTSREARKAQNTSSLESTHSTCSLSMISARNTDEKPLTLSSNQAVFTNEPQKSDTETEVQSLDARPATSINNEALQKSDESSDERILKSLLASLFEEKLDNHEQILFKAYKENNSLKEKYLALTTLAFQVIKGCQQIKTRIAKLTLLELAKNDDSQSVSQLKSFFYHNLNSLLINFFNYYQLVEELQPQKIPIQTKISFNEMKKNHNQVVIKIQKVKKQLLNSKKKYNFVLNKKQITKTKVIQEMFCRLTEQRAMKIFKDRFTNLSVDKIKEIIFSNHSLSQLKDNSNTENVTQSSHESIKSNEALKLEFLLANIFTTPFYCDEQILFKVYEENHSLKDKYLMLMMFALNAKKACLQIKTRIAQLEHFEQGGSHDSRSMKLVKTILCKELNELITSSSGYYQLMEELKPSEIQVAEKISSHKMKQINSTPLEKIRALKVKIRCAQKYYNTILNEKQTTESIIIQNILNHLTEYEAIKTIQEEFTSLSEIKIKEIIISTKIIPQIEDNKNTEETPDSLQKKNETEETLMLKSMLVNIFKNSFHFDEKLLFDAYINNNTTKEDFLAFIISALQAKEACIKIKTRIIQLIYFEQKKHSRECDISSVKNYLYRDLTELFINSSNYNRLRDKLNQPRVQTQASKNMTSSQMRMLDKGIIEQIRRKKKQLRATLSYFNLTNRNRQVKEKQIIQSMLMYLTEQKAIIGFKKKFASLTEDKIKETITRSILLIAENQNNEAIEDDDWSLSLEPPTKKICTQESVDLSETLSTVSQSSPQASVLRFSPEASTAIEPSQSTEIHFPSSAKSTPVQEEMKFAETCQISTVPPDIPLSVLFFELFEQEGISEDLDMPSSIQLTDFENE